MLDLTLGILAAVVASTFYSLGVALQAMDAKEAPAGAHLRLALAVRLIRRSRWLLGTGLSILGWPLQVVALLLAPLVVVQPTLAAGLLVLVLVGERMLGERAGKRERLAILAIVVGVAGAAAVAPARSSGRHAEDLTLLVVLAGLALVSLSPYILRALGRGVASVTIVSAGLAYGWSGVATKLASDDLARGHLLVAAGWALGTAAASAVGALSEMSALQERPAIQVAPVVFVTQTVVPVALAPVLLGEHFASTALDGAPLALSIAVLILGAALLARSPLLVTLMEGGRSSDSSDSTCSPSTRSLETIRSSPATDACEPSALTTSTSPSRIER